MTAPEPTRALALHDGAMPSLALSLRCVGLGVDLLPYVECMPLNRLPRLLLGAFSPWRLGLGLSADFSGFAELTPALADSDGWTDCVDAVAAGGIAVAMTSANAYSHDIPAPFVAALARRFPGAACIPAMELALYEAMANAIIHGNLGIDSSLRGSAEGLRDYRLTLARALSDPGRSARLVTVACRPHGHMLRLTVRDQGNGWDVARQLESPAAVAAKSGRGLDLIRQSAAAIQAKDDGRLLIMDFQA